MARWFTLFQVAFGLLIAFSTSLESSVIEVKPAAPVTVDTTVSLKAKSRHKTAVTLAAHLRRLIIRDGPQVT